MNLTKSKTESTLQIILHKIQASRVKINFRLIGTAAAQIRGITIPTADIDLLAESRKDVDAFIEIFRDFIDSESPKWFNCSNQYYASFQIDSTRVEISTVEIDSRLDIMETFGHGPWIHYSMISIGEYEIPAVALELRLISEVLRERTDRIYPIVDYLKQNSLNTDLLKRTLSENRPDYNNLNPTIAANIKKELGIE